MGQKVHPKGFRLGIIENWDSVWYADRNYSDQLVEDSKLRRWLSDRVAKAGVSRIRIKRRANQIEIDLYVARPGMVIGKGGAEAALVRDELVKLLGGRSVQLNVLEEERIEANAQLLAESVASALIKRVAFRRVMRQVVSRALKAGALGAKVNCAGRLAGAEIARSEWYREGRLPLHSLRARIDYGFTEAQTIYGKIGVKVWVYLGDVVPEKKKAPAGEPEAKG